MLRVLRKTIGWGGFELAGSGNAASSEAGGLPSSRNHGANWSEQRQRCLERDGYQCRICGADPLEVERALPVHHITPRNGSGRADRSDVDSLGNLVTLCPSCHERFEGEFVGATPSEFVERAHQTRSE